MAKKKKDPKETKETKDPIDPKVRKEFMRLVFGQGLTPIEAAQVAGGPKFVKYVEKNRDSDLLIQKVYDFAPSRHSMVRENDTIAVDTSRGLLSAFHSSGFFQKLIDMAHGLTLVENSEASDPEQERKDVLRDRNDARWLSKFIERLLPVQHAPPPKAKSTAREMLHQQSTEALLEMQKSKEKERRILEIQREKATRGRKQSARDNKKAKEVAGTPEGPIMPTNPVHFEMIPPSHLSRGTNTERKALDG